MSPLPTEIADQILTGEEILWQGRPLPYVFILRGLPNIAYGVTWSVLGAYWYQGSGGISEETSAFEGVWRIVPLLSIPFIIVGFSFWLYPIRLGVKARRTWYVVTNRRVFIAELTPGEPSKPHLRVFSAEEMAPPQVVKRFDGLYDVILTRRAQVNPHLTPRLDSGFFGLKDGEAVAGAVNTATNP
jgi:hypothetical protein